MTGQVPGWDRGWTIADCVAAQADGQPDRVAVEVLAPRQAAEGADPTSPAETWTYGRLWDRVEAIAAAVGEVPPGPHGPMVAIMAPNCVDHLAAYLACQVVGAAAVPVNNRLAVPEVAFVLSDSGARVALGVGQHVAALAGGAAQAMASKGGQPIEVVDLATVGPAPTTGPRWSGPAGHEAADRLAVIAYTSGTTGFPKGSIITNAALLLRLTQWSWTFGLTPDQVLSTPGPLFHLSYGGLSLAHLASGGRNRLQVDFDPSAALVEYAQHSTWAFLVPSMTAMIAEAWEAAGKPPLAALRWLLSSGAPGPMSLLDRAFDIFPNANIAEGYGWTEGGWVTYEVKRRADLVPHSVGWPVLGTRIDLRDDQGRPVPDGQPGELVARSLTPFIGYLGRPDATAAAFTDDGFCRSGDVGIRLPDGRLTIVDRVKDMIISGGENIYCAEVERILVEHDGIAEAAVVGLPDDTWGERVTAAVVARPGHTLGADEVIGHCRARLAGYKCPKEVAVLDALPRNPMGKVQKFALIEQLTGR